MDFTFRDGLAVVALLAFNLPVLFTAWKLVFVPVPVPDPAAAGKPRALSGLTDALQEKDGNGNPTGVISYSRVTGVIGTTVVASLFWVISNVVIATAIIDPPSVSNILSDVTKLFLVGAALFVPYAFNQLKSLLQ